MFSRIVFLMSLLFALPVQSADWKDEIIYFIMLDRFADGDPTNNQTVDRDNPIAFHGGDLKGLTENLDEIADLGATAIWFTPIVQQVPKPVEAEGLPFHGHHGYWAEDFTQLDPRYGTEDDLKSLVDAAHDKGLKIILDVVYNHVGYGAEWTHSRPEWLRQGDDCGGDAITLCLSGLPDLKTELPEVRDYLLDAHIGLAERVGADGFRLDTYKHISQEFWEDHRAATRDRLGEEFFLIGEIWDADKYIARKPFEEDTLDGVLDFSFRDRTLKLLNGVENPARYARYFIKRHDIPDGHILAPFLSSHDVPMLLAMLRGDTDKLRIAFALLMFAEGTPVITWGEEVGRRGGLWPDNREDMAWGVGSTQMPGAGKVRDNALRADIKTMLSLRKSYDDMRHATVETIEASGDILVLKKGKVMLAVNRGNAGQDMPPLPDGNWVTVLGAQHNDLTLPAMSYRFLVNDD
jgi:alpha-amylase